MTHKAQPERGSDALKGVRVFPMSESLVMASYMDEVRMPRAFTDLSQIYNHSMKEVLPLHKRRGTEV